MGIRGPVPAPDNVRSLRGMKPLKGPDGKKARRIVLAPKAPAMPDLSRDAANEWRRITKELERAGVLAEVDRGILVAYCQAWAHMMEAERILRREKVVRPNREKVPVKHPAWQVWREANRTLVNAAGQLYLTPVARLRIPLAPGSTSDDGSDDDLFD